MTVSASNADVRYAGDGSSTVFATGFTFYNASSLEVSVITAGVVATKVLVTDYTVSGGNGATGSVTFLVAPAISAVVVIQRNEPFTQETDLGTNDPLPAEVLELTFDKIVMQIQQIYRASQTSIQADPSFDPNSQDPYFLPAPESSKVLVGNSDETGWENGDIADLVSSVDTIFSGLADKDFLRYDSGGAVWRNFALYSATNDFTAGRVLVPTRTAGDSGTDTANTAFVTAAVAAVNFIRTGDVKFTIDNSAETGWIGHTEGGTIGDATSAGTVRANADTSALYALMYSKYDNTDCPVSGGRGANAAADFAAHKTLRLPPFASRLVGVVGSGSGLTARAIGDQTGAETTVVTQASLGITNSGLGGVGGGNLADVALPTASTPAIIPPSFWLFAKIKL